MITDKARLGLGISPYIIDTLQTQIDRSHLCLNLLRSSMIDIDKSVDF